MAEAPSLKEPEDNLIPLFMDQIVCFRRILQEANRSVTEVSQWLLHAAGFCSA